MEEDEVVESSRTFKPRTGGMQQNAGVSRYEIRRQKQNAGIVSVIENCQGMSV